MGGRFSLTQSGPHSEAGELPLLDRRGGCAKKKPLSAQTGWLFKLEQNI
jgi:hypothetical protein